MRDWFVPFFLLIYTSSEKFIVETLLFAFQQSYKSKSQTVCFIGKNLVWKVEKYVLFSGWIRGWQVCFHIYKDLKHRKIECEHLFLMHKSKCLNTLFYEGIFIFVHVFEFFFLALLAWLLTSQLVYLLFVQISIYVIRIFLVIFIRLQFLYAKHQWIKLSLFY